MKSEVLIKIFSDRKAYDFYPDTYDKDILKIGGSIECDIWVPELKESQYLLDGTGTKPVLVFIDKDENPIEKIGVIDQASPYFKLNENIHLIALYVQKGRRQSYRYYSLIDIKNISFQTVRVGEITIGSADVNVDFNSKTRRIKHGLTQGHLCVSDKNLPLISSKHGIIYYNDFGEFWIEDTGATNGIYVNGFLLEKPDENSPACKKLEYGDVIDLFTTKIVFLESYLQVEVLTGKAQLTNLDEIKPITLSEDDNSPILMLPPRKERKLPDDEVKIPSPPSESRDNQDFIRIISYIARPLVWLVGPLVVSGATSGVNTMGAQILRIITYTISPLMMILMYVRRSKQVKEENKRRFKNYKEKLRKKIKIIDRLKKQQNEIFSKTHTSPEDNIRRAVSVDWRLWERSTDAEDFLEFKIGEGMAQPSFEINTPDEDNLDDKPEELRDLLIESLKEHKDVSNYPITLDLKSTPNVGLVGVYYSRMKALKSYIMQLCIHHSAEDLRVACIYPSNQRHDFEPMKFLPHFWMEDRSGRMMFTGDMRVSTCEGECMKSHKEKTCPQCYKNAQLNALLLKIDQRQKMAADDSKKTDFTPKYLFIVSDTNLVKDDNSHDICNYLLNDYSHLGIYSIFLGEQRTDIPADFSTIITTGFEKGMMESPESDEKRFHLDIYEDSDVEKISRALAPIRIENLNLSRSVPSYVTLLDLFGAKNLNDLQIISRWKNQHQHTVPRAPVGMYDQKNIFELDITRKGIGPHGVVGGTTGSGKSEFLLSVILGMAVNCHPHRMGMVVLDYKGGSTAEACKNLPHVHGIVTDLDKGVMTKRALAAIKYEVEYRENQFRKFSNSTGQRIEDLKSYIKIVKDGPIIPYLLVIVDELAELKIREPAAMEILEDIARRGRSVGIYLLLTTQNPQGVINSQIQANINYRICFRISKDNSRGIIDSPDAAYISDKTPGRALMRVGNNELVAFQSAYTGARYITKDAQEEEVDIPDIYALDLEGQRKPMYINEEQKSKQEKVSQLNVVVDEIIQIAKISRLKELKNLWMEPLPDKLILPYIMGDVNFDGKKWSKSYFVNLSVFVGLADDIRDRLYIPAIVDFEEEKSHLAVYGPSYSGKTTFLYTMIMSLAYQNSPLMLNMYYFDFSPSPTYVISQLPHMGNVFLGAKKDDVNAGCELLQKELKRRAKLFSESSVSNIKEYNSIEKESKKLPYVFIFIDNADQMAEYPAKELAGFEEIMRTGISHGFYYVITAPDRRTLPYEFRRYMESNVVCLWPEEVMGFDLPRRFSMTSRAQGRGFYKGLEFQTALPVDVDESESLSMSLANSINKMQKTGAGKNVLRSKSISTSFNMEDLEKDAPLKTDTNIPIGFDLNKQEIEYIDIEQNRSMMFSYINKAELKDKMAVLYNRMKKNSKSFAAKPVSVITEDKAWIKSLQGFKDMEVFEIAEGCEKDLEAYVLALVKGMCQGPTNRLIICDAWDKVIDMSTEDAYLLLRHVFKDELLRQNAYFMLAANQAEIEELLKGGSPQLTKPLNEFTVLTDKKSDDHSWQLIKTSKDAEIDENCIMIIQDNKSGLIRLR